MTDERGHALVQRGLSRHVVGRVQRLVEECVGEPAETLFALDEHGRDKRIVEEPEGRVRRRLPHVDIPPESRELARVVRGFVVVEPARVRDAADDRKFPRLRAESDGITRRHHPDHGRTREPEVSVVALRVDEAVLDAELLDRLHVREQIARTSIEVLPLEDVLDVDAALVQALLPSRRLREISDRGATGPQTNEQDEERETATSGSERTSFRRFRSRRSCLRPVPPWIRW